MHYFFRVKKPAGTANAVARRAGGLSAKSCVDYCIVARGPFHSFLFLHSFQYVDLIHFET